MTLLLLALLAILWAKHPDPDDEAAGIIRNPYSERL